MVVLLLRKMSFSAIIFMNHETYNGIYDEREEAFKILERYQQLERSRRKNVAGIVFLCYFFSMMMRNHPLQIYVLCGMLVGWLYMLYAERKALHEFITEMTPQEHDLLARTSTVGFSKEDKRAAKGLKRLYHKIHPEREYLRASSPTQDDGTLLRAASHGGEIPQEELLRASNTSAQEQRHEENISLVAR
jgi:hypothetical protein